MKVKLIALFACVALCACLLPGMAFAADSAGGDTLQATSGSLQVQATIKADSTCALLHKNGWLYRCDSDGNAITSNATLWTAADLAKVKRLYVASNVTGLANYSSVTANLDYTHPRVKVVNGSVTTSARVCLAGQPTVSAPYVLTAFNRLSFLLNSSKVNKCATIAEGLFADSLLYRFDNLDKTSITQIGARAFARCVKLYKNVKIPATCTTIGTEAFMGCTKLSAVTFKKGVAKLGTRSFSGCTKLGSASLPDTCKSVGKQAFAGCTALKSVAIGTAKKTKIGVEAFSGCTSLTKASLGPCSTIGQSAFSGCIKLSSASIDQCTTIGVSAFADCAKLSSVALGPCKTIDASAFANCTRLKSISLGSTEAVNASAFANCPSLGSVNLSSCVSVGASAFANCTSLGSVSLPACKTIGAAAFEGCTALSTMNFGTVIRKVGSRAFASTKIAKLEFSKKTKSLPADLMGPAGSASVPLKLVILRSAKVVSIPNDSVFSNTPLANVAAKAKYIYVPKNLYKKYVKNSASNNWRLYRNKFRKMPEISKAKVKVANVTYNGKYRTPKVHVKFGKKTLKEGVDYEVVYSRNKSAGTARAKVVGKGIYNGTKTATFTIRKAANTLKVKNVTRYVTDTVVKKKGATIYGATGIEGAQGATTFTKLTGSSSQLSIDASSGAVSVAKGTKSGTYKMKIRVRAAGNSNYKAKSKKFTLSVKVASKAEVAKHHSAATFISIALTELNKWNAGQVPSDKYWRAFDKKAESWCSEFVGWCLRESGLVQGVTMPSNPSYAKAYYNFYSKHPELATIHVNDGTYTPKPGDIVLQIHNGDPSWFWHTEMITWCDGYNYGGVSGGWRVSNTSRSLGSSSFYYFITIKWDAV